MIWATLVNTHIDTYTDRQTCRQLSISYTVYMMFRNYWHPQLLTAHLSQYAVYMYKNFQIKARDNAV